MLVVVKIGTSSLVDQSGALSRASIAKIAKEVAEQRELGNQVIVVSSAALAAGLDALGMAAQRPSDVATLQAASTVGQVRLMECWREELSANGLVSGQLLLASLDFIHRKQYLYARDTITRMLELGIVPVFNENIAQAELRFDNDRWAALVAHLMHADVLVLLTDTPGMFTADPRFDQQASLIEEIVEVDNELERSAQGSVSGLGLGGMASKLAAAKMAAWSGIRTVIASATVDEVVAAAVEGRPGIGTVVRPREKQLPARKLWIAFAVAAKGTLFVDEGARDALVRRSTSLLPAGITKVDGSFDEDDAVEIADTSGQVFAKGLVRHAAYELREWMGKKSSELPQGVVPEAVHRDDLVVLP